MSSIPFTPPQDPDYAWEVATLFPAQGHWSLERYLELTDGTNRRIEFTDGRLEFLPMATEIHQALVRFLFFALYQFVDGKKLGEAYDSGLRVRVRPDKIRQPDVLFLHKNNFHLRHNRVWDGANLVMEVVSDDPKDRQRDYEEKLADYAEGNIAEYWIVDPDQRHVLVYSLRDGRYGIHGRFEPGQQATSVLLPEFAIDVTSLFAKIKEIPE